MKLKNEILENVPMSQMDEIITTGETIAPKKSTQRKIKIDNVVVATVEHHDLPDVQTLDNKTDVKKLIQQNQKTKIKKSDAKKIDEIKKMIDTEKPKIDVKSTNDVKLFTPVVIAKKCGIDQKHVRVILRKHKIQKNVDTNKYGFDKPKFDEICKLIDSELKNENMKKLAVAK